MKLLYLLICLTFIFSKTTCLETLPLPSLNANQTSKTSVKLNNNISSNSFVILLDFIKRFFVALYDKNLTKILNMITCVINDLRIGRFYFLLAFDSLKKLDFLNFFRLLYQALKYSLIAPGC